MRNSNLIGDGKKDEGIIDDNDENGEDNYRLDA
jgi:hypothetical protein